MNKRIKESWAYIVVALYVLSVVCYVFCEGEDVYVQIHDNLDSNITWYKMLKDHHLFWVKDADMPFLGGVSRNMMPSQMLAYTWLYMIFPVFYAFVIGNVLRVLLAVAGSVYLAESIYGTKEFSHKNMVVLCGFVYGIMPVFPTSGFAFASLPLLMGLLYRLYDENEKWLFVALLFYPVLSRLATFGVFICGFLLLFFILDWIVGKKPKWRMLWGMAALVAGYCLTEYRVIYYMLLSTEPSIKFSRVKTYLPLGETLREALHVFISGHYHSGSMHTYVILPFCCAGIAVINIYYLKCGRKLQIVRDRANWIFLWIVVNCLLYGFDSYEPLKNLIGMIVPKLRNFSVARALWLNPFLWSFLFCILLCRLLKKGWKKMAYTAAILQIAILLVLLPSNISYNDYSANVCNRIYEWTGVKLPGADKAALTYREFYSEDLFDAIKEEIGYQGEPSVAFGMHPAVLCYNQITTLDGYSSVYPQSYKEKFRKLIEPDLEVDTNNRKRFDDAGIRAYLYSNEIGFQPRRVMEKDAAALRIDADVFAQMGGKYVFSRVKVTNDRELGLELLGTYQKESSPYTIYVYQK